MDRQSLGHMVMQRKTGKMSTHTKQNIQMKKKRDKTSILLLH